MNKPHHPPPWADRLLEWFCAPHLLEEVQGDLHEMYGKWVEHHGVKKAKWLYVMHALKFLRPYAFKRLTIYNPTNMLKNYFIIAIRNLRRKKVYSTLNILGLTIGIACCMLIFQYVAFEQSFDTFHTKADQLYRVVRTTYQNEASLGDMVWTGYGEAPTYAQEVPGIVQFTRVHAYFGGAVISPAEAPDKIFKEERSFYVDPAFLTMFTVPLVAGNPSNALTQPHTVLISQSTAQKYFGHEEAIGKILTIQSGYTHGDYQVTGLFADVPVTSHLQYDFLFPMRDLLAFERYKEASTAWSNNNFYTYVEVNKTTSVNAVESQLTQVYTRHQREGLQATHQQVKMWLEPLPDIHLNGDIRVPFTNIGDRKTVYFFTIVALITLVIALVNYVNLSTARALDRAKEVGVRKVVGAHRRQLVFQFLSEAAVMNGMALALAVGLSFLLTPVINRLADVELTGAIWRNSLFLTSFALVFSTGTFLSALYPAFILSGFKPIAILKGNTKPSTAGFSLRKGLVVGQFAASIILIVGTLVVFTQLNHMRNIDLGLQLDQVLYFHTPRTLGEGSSRETAINTLIQELRKLSGVQQVSESASVPGNGFNWNSSMHLTSADPSTQQRSHACNIDPAFFDVYGLELLAGQPFTESTQANWQEGSPTPAIVNETAIGLLGLPSPESALGQDINFGGGKFRIQGVAKDFNWSSAHGARDPVIFYPVGKYDPGSTISVKLSAGNLPDKVASVQEVYERLFPGNPWEFSFVDDTFDAQYRNDERFAAIFGVFAGIAILIACLGLFGLATFTAQQRTKEIGIRKTLGATVIHIIGLLSSDFLKLVGFAFLLAIPIAYFAMTRWLENFAYRIEIGIGVFLVAGLATLLIALATVSWQSIKTALTNPINSLRNE